MFRDDSSRLQGAAVGLLTLVLFFVLLQIGLQVTQALADTGGGSASTSVVPDPVSDEVGATAAEFRVDESGAATYSIPLYGVPGVAGVAPKLSLNYSSQGGYGPLGKGWSIGGLSSISRCRATREAGDFIVGGVATDGDPAPINFTSTDRYCLDGQRLLAVANSPVCPAATGMGVQQFRTEIESFQRVCAYTPSGGTSGVAFFTVERKDGSISWYGDRVSNNTQDLTYNGYFNSTAPGKVSFALSWAQTRFQDSTGNYIDFRYHESLDSAVGEQLIKEVQYTGKKQLTGQATVSQAPFARISFAYSPPLAMPSKGYQAGGLLTQAHRLEAIAACTSIVSCTPAQQARYYELTYATSASGSGLDTLVGIQECRDNSLAVCLQPTTFAWSAARNEQATAEGPDDSSFGGAENFEGFKLADIDGDGRQDMVWLKDDGASCSTEQVLVSYSDLDASGNQAFSVSGAMLCSPTELITPPTSTTDTRNLGDASWQLFDYNGDGRDDLFVAGATTWAIYASRGRPASGQAFDTSVNLLAAIPIPVDRTTSNQRKSHPQLADLNGDGLLDVVYKSQGAHHARLMTLIANNFAWGTQRDVIFPAYPANNPCAGPPPGWSNCTSIAYYELDQNIGTYQLYDFNGDARSDLAMHAVTAWDYTVDESCDLGPPTGHCDYERDAGSIAVLTVQSITATQITYAAYASWPSRPGNLIFHNMEVDEHFADFNGDGSTDLLLEHLGNNWELFLNTGTGFAPAIQVTEPPNEKQVQIADANGDGRADLLYWINRTSDKVYVGRLALPNGGFAQQALLWGDNAALCEGINCDAQQKVALFGDLDSDGGLDFLSLRMAIDMDLYVSRAGAGSRWRPRDVIIGVTNGLGAQTDIVYASLNIKDVYRRRSDTRNTVKASWGRGAPVQDLLAPSYVVARASSSAPRAAAPTAKATVHYRYADAKVQGGGRGFLGFGTIETIDPNQGNGYIVTTTSYAQNFPYAGMPQQTVKSVVSGQTYAIPACLNGLLTNACFTTPGQAFPSLGGSWFSDNDHSWEVSTGLATQTPLHVRTDGTVETLRDPATGQRTSQVLTTFGYGTYGNVTTTTVDTFTGTSTTAMSSVSTTNSYGDDNATLWRLGRLTDSAVTHSRPGEQPVVRTTRFDYSMAGAATGLLTEERTEPGSMTDDLRKLYTLDDYGNRTGAFTCVASTANCTDIAAVNFHPGLAVHRYSRSLYDARGRFPLKALEPFWSVDGTIERVVNTVVARNIFGDVTQAYDLNGVDTLAVTGNLGRAYYSWTEAVAGSTPGATSGGVESWTTYRLCGTGTDRVNCPTGAKFRQRVVAEGAPRQWTYFDVLGRPVMKAAESFNANLSGKDVAASCTDYDATGKPSRASHPFFLAGTGGTDGPTGLDGVCTAAARLWTVSTYDLLGRPTAVETPDPGPDGFARVTNVYNNLTTGTRDPRQNLTNTFRNGKGEITHVVNTQGLGLYNVYDAAGNIKEIYRDGGRGTITNRFAYDILGRKIAQYDPDSGDTTYEYNALGELVAQQDSQGQRIENDYDARGRVWRRTVIRIDPALSYTQTESTALFVFDIAANGLGQLASESIAGLYEGWAGDSSLGLDFVRSYAYDTLGRPLSSTTTIDDAPYTMATAYDGLGRAFRSKDVSGNWVKTAYTTRGFPAEVCFSDQNDFVQDCATPWQTTQETDAWGHTLREVRSNSGQMTITRTYEPLNGRVSRICADKPGGSACELVNEAYAWDPAGNLSSHQKEMRYLEGFQYDTLNRLEEGRILVRNGIPEDTVSQAFVYDKLGNICRKQSLGVTQDYTYVGMAGCGLVGTPGGGSYLTQVGPHQVYQADGAAYYYDPRGNQIRRDAAGTAQDRFVSYSLDDKPYQVDIGSQTTPSARSRFWYGPDGQRYKAVHTQTGDTVLYLGNVEVTKIGATTTFRRYIGGFLLQTIPVGGTTSNEYLFHDQLGSLVRVTDINGAIQDRIDYAAFGERRSATDPNAGGPGSSSTRRGFTNHEHFGALGIIHMNGRIYDADLGRFMQADPIIQAPGNAQSWNAYSYVANNPLRYTDSTGMEIDQGIREALGIIIAAVYMYFTVDPNGGMSIYGAIAIGFVSGYVATGTFKGGVQGALIAGLTFGIGAAAQAGDWDNWIRVGAQAMAGGITQYLQGGNFGNGFLAAGLTAAFMPHTGKIGNDLVRTTVGALVGGTISKLTGGKFANGAVSGAIQGAMAGGDQPQRDMQQDASGSDGEWIYPDGGSTNINEYDTVMTNGINGDRDAFIKALNSSPTPTAGYFNPSHGFGADIAESFGQKYFGASGDPLAAGFANGLAGVDHSMTIIAHSQGTLTVANAARYYGLPRGSTFVMRSPALSYFSASSAVRMNGGTMQYTQPWGDVANIYAPTMNPIKWMSGFRDLTCGMCTHKANGLP